MTPPPPTPQYLSDRFCLSFTKAELLFFFMPRWYCVMVLETRFPDESLLPLSSKFRDMSDLDWGGAVSAGERPGRGCLPCWTCPALPRLWYWSALPSCGARLPVISLPFLSHHLSALWIQLHSPKRATTPQLKRLICPLTAPPHLPSSCLPCLH